MDALNPNVITALIEDELKGLIDDEKWDAATERQKTARAQLDGVSEKWDDVTGLLDS